MYVLYTQDFTVYIYSLNFVHLYIYAYICVYYNKAPNGEI